MLFSVLALSGYYYTAVGLEFRLLISGLVLGLAMLLHSLLRRWSALVQRRLTRARVRAAREAVRAAEQSGDATTAKAGEVPDILELDLVSVNDQTRRLVGLAVGMLAAVGIWLTWRDLVPAFAILEDITLWHHAVNIEGVDSLAPTTLADLGWALLVALLTFVAGRNLPGLLEISILARFELRPGTLYAVATLTKYAIITAGFIVALNLIGIGWTQVQWLAAAVGVGLGFGLREIFASYIAGLIILFERPVRVGDVVTLGELSGMVTSIRIRSTTITDWDNKEIVIPNNILISQQLTNWTLTNEVTRVVIKLGIARGSDTDVAKQVMRDIVSGNRLVLQDPPPEVLFLGFGEHSLEFEVRAFTNDIEHRLELVDEMHTKLNRGLREHGIEIALPQMHVQMRSEQSAGETEVVRPAQAVPPTSLGKT